MRDHQFEQRRPAALRRDATPAARERADHLPASGNASALDPATVLRLQRTAGNASVVQLLAGEEGEPAVHDVIGSGGGSPLDASTRSGMESAFGTSFEHVRVHTDDRASRSAESVGAQAYTVGSDIAFRAGQYNPSSPTGQRTIAHELAHVVQQSQGPVEGTDAGGGVRLSDPSDRFERAAESTADEVMASVQRQQAPDEEEEEIQA